MTPAATRRIAKTSTEVGYAGRGHKGAARKAAARAVRRGAAAEIAASLAE